MNRIPSRRIASFFAASVVTAEIADQHARDEGVRHTSNSGHSSDRLRDADLGQG